MMRVVALILFVCIVPLVHANAYSVSDDFVRERGIFHSNNERVQSFRMFRTTFFEDENSLELLYVAIQDEKRALFQTHIDKRLMRVTHITINNSTIPVITQPSLL